MYTPLVQIVAGSAALEDGCHGGEAQAKASQSQGNVGKGDPVLGQCH